MSETKLEAKQWGHIENFAAIDSEFFFIFLIFFKIKIKNNNKIIKIKTFFLKTNFFKTIFFLNINKIKIKYIFLIK